MTPNPQADRDRAAWRAFRENAEGGYQAMKDDHSNWYKGKLLGTSHGITPATLSAWRKKPVTSHDMQHLSWDEADRIAYAFYWQPCGGDYLPSGVNLMVADFGWGSGAHTSVRMLQELLGFIDENVDGIVGTETLQACIGAGSDLIDVLHDAQADFYASLGSRFLRGWDNRDDWRRTLAKTLVTT